VSGTADKPLRADARRNRARLLEVAARAFAECGMDLPMEELARRAGVGIGTVYRHFPNKEALLDALRVDQLTWQLERTRQALAEDDAWQAFRDLVHDGAARQAQDVASCDLIMSNTVVESETAAALREDGGREMAKLIERAQASGGMRADFTTADVPLLFASIVGAIRAFGPAGPWRRQVDFALDGLRAS
jgi:AcrR family transcriptional regulator